MTATVPRTPFLDLLTLEVRYAYGLTYLDRCGQTLVDIERMFGGWVPGDVSVAQGNMSNPEAERTLSFSADAFSYSARGHGNKLETLAAESSSLWDVVRANLGLSELVRIGCRLQYLLAKDGLEEAERAALRSRMNVVLPPIGNKTYERVRQNPVLSLRNPEDKTGAEYRVSMQAVIRTAGVSTSTLVHTNPRLLSKSRREAQKRIIQAQIDYNRNPMYGVMLDVDCSVQDPATLKVRDFVLKHSFVVASDFVPLLEGL